MEPESNIGGAKRKYGENYEPDNALDSSAPLSALLDDIYKREFRGWKAYRLYWQLLHQRTNNGDIYSRSAYHFAVPGHPLNAFSEKYDGTTYYNYFEEFPYRSLSPKYITPMRNIHKLDPVVQPLKIKVEWQDRVSLMRSMYCFHSPKTKIERLNEEVIYCPKYMIDYAAALEQHPNSYCSDSYNWHYAGSGNMHVVCVHGVDYLVHSEFSCMYVSRFHKDTMTIDIENSTTFDCEHNILETICSQNNIVALRATNIVFILKIKEIDGNISIEKLSSFESDMLFTSIAFDKHHKNILYATKLDCTLSIVNLDRMTQKKVELKKRYSSLQNNWNSVMGSKRDMYVHIERDCITCYDKRSNDVVNSWTGIVGVVDDRGCNDITAAIQLEDDHGLYFATRHHLFLMDTRCSKTRKLNVLQRWMHGLQCPPIYISMGTKSNKNFIFLSSQWCEDLCVVSNYADRITRSGELPGVAVPYHPPHIFNVLNEARLKLLCWDDHNPIVDRLVTSMTGKVEVDTADGFTVLMQNSLGDVSAHVLYPTYMDNFMEDDAVQSLSEWSKANKLDRKLFEVSGIHDISKIWKNLRKIPDHNYDLYPNQPKIVVNESEIHESFSNGELMPELLEAWVTKVTSPESSNLNIPSTNDDDYDDNCNDNCDDDYEDEDE